MTRGDVSNALEVGGEDSRRLKDWNGDGDKLRVLEMGFDGFQLQLGGLSEGYSEGGTNDKETAKNHEEGKTGSGSESKEERGVLNVFPTTFQVITTHPPPLTIFGGDDGAGRTATASVWPRV